VSNPNVCSKLPALHVSLPRAEPLTDLILSPACGEPGENELTRAKERVVSELERISFGLKRGMSLRINQFRLEKVLESPSRVRGDEPFSPSPAACRRAIGTAAIARCLNEPGGTPSRAVSDVLDMASRRVEPYDFCWWGDWFSRLPFGARGVVQAEAVTWATQLHGALDWTRFESVPETGIDYRFESPTRRPILIHSKIDIRVQVDQKPVFFLLPTGVAGKHWNDGFLLAVLAAALCGGITAVPTRVVGLWPSSGQVRVLEVESGTIERAADVVCEAAVALAHAEAQARPM
jgi:hypothetical protein